MGRYRIYRTRKSLEAAVESYFRRISRTELVKEPVGTGQFDKYGHEIMQMVPVYNDDGEEIWVQVFQVPPTRGDLCQHIGVSRDTWRRYCDREAYPQFAEITEWAEDQLRSWRDRELHIRDDKHIKGLIFDLQANYGASEKRTVEVKTGDGGNRELSSMSDSELRAMVARAEQDERRK